MSPVLFGNIAGTAAAVAVGVGGVWWLWGHATRRKYGPDDLVTIAEFSNATEAALCRSKLQSVGVECMLTGTGSAYARSLFLSSSSMRTLRIKVLGRDVARARQALSAFQPD